MTLTYQWNQLWIEWRLNLGADNDIRVGTIIKQADIDSIEMTSHLAFNSLLTYFSHLMIKNCPKKLKKKGYDDDVEFNDENFEEEKLKQLVNFS